MRRLMVPLTTLVALLFIVPSLSSAGSGGGHAGMRTGGVAGLRGQGGAGFLRPVGVHTFGHPGFTNGFVVPSNRVTELAARTRTPNSQASRSVSPPLIIERHGDTYERLAQTNRPVSGPLVLERRGDTFEEYGKQRVRVRTAIRSQLGFL